MATSVQHPGPIRGRTAAEIVASVEAALGGGLLSAGQRLPAVRALARGLRVSPATVAAAYRALQSRGVIVSRGRRGTTVVPRAENRALLPMALPAGVRNLYDGNPDPDLLPPLAPILRRIDASAMLYGEPGQTPELEQVVARQLRADGVLVGPLSVVNGALDGIELVLAAHLRPGDRVAVEDPGFGNIFDLITGRGLSLVPVELDQLGIRPDGLRRALSQRIAAVVITTRSQNPTGAALSAERARALRRVLRDAPDVLLIEDDHMNFVADVPSVCVHGRETRRWAHVRSLSKALNPDLRVAVMTGDGDSMQRVQQQLATERRWVSHILQRIAHALLSDAGVRAGLRAAAATYAQRRAALLAALSAVGVRASGRSGFNVWVPVPEESPVVQGMLQRGWAVRAGARFRIATPPAIRITAAALPASDAPQVARALADVLAGVSRSASA